MSATDIKITDLGDSCCGCGACAAKCPKSCISMVEDAAGFAHPAIDANACIGCHACESACPALNPCSADESVRVRWARGKSEELLDSSSSGGMFGLLAEDVLDDDGVVCGATWTEDCKRVQHVLIERAADLDCVMRSKYVQSAVSREVYEVIRAALKDGRRVLFAGTACQVAGLRAYLGRLADSEKFLAVDVICHGVPSPKLWSEWVSYKESLSGSNVCDVNMRSKTTGWLSYSAMYKYIAEKDTPYRCESTVFGNDWYMKAFLANASLRPSCFACPVKHCCGSDITLGDFWGFQNIHPEVDCSKGISAVICNTERGVKAFEAVADELESGEATFEQVVVGNPSLVKPVQPYEHRVEFMADLCSGMGVEALMRKYDFKPSFWRRVRGKLGGVKRRLGKLVGKGR